MTERSTAHVDTFVRDNLPPPEMWPATDWSGVPALSYPATLNAATPLLDDWVTRGQGDRPALHHANGTWTYRQLFETANQIAHVLVDDCGLMPGGRVLLRAANQPLLVACWFAVIKAGGVAVTTMPLLRARELSGMMETAHVNLAIADESVAADLTAALATRAGARIVTFNTEGPASLASLPAALRESLALALEKLDVAAIDRAIEAVRRQDSQAAGVLSRLAKSFDSACAGCFDLSWARRPCAPHQATSVHLRSLAAEATVASMNRTPRAPSSTSAYSRAAGAMRPPCPRARMSAAMPR